jgi:hypothetical protein
LVEATLGYLSCAGVAVEDRDRLACNIRRVVREPTTFDLARATPTPQLPNDLNLVIPALHVAF